MSFLLRGLSWLFLATGIIIFSACSGGGTSTGDPETGTASVTFSPNPSDGAIGNTIPIFLSCTTAGAKIFYTTDGSDPVISISKKEFTASFLLENGDWDVKAFAVADGNSSATTEKHYTVSGSTTAQVTFSPASSSISTEQGVTLSSSTAGADIYYTTDGTDPTTSSTKKKYSAAFTLELGTKTVTAYALKTGLSSSVNTSKTYTVFNTTTTCSIVVFSPAASAVSTADSILLTSETSGATIYYTTDGTDPKTSATRKIYTDGFKLSAGVITVKAYAAKATYTDSDTSDMTYSVSAPDDTITIYYYTTSSTMPTIWMWEDAGRAIMTLEGNTWPGPAMTNAGGNWASYDIPKTYYPLNLALKFKFNSGAEVTLPAPVDGDRWYKDGTWYKYNTSGPSATAAPETCTFENTLSITLNASNPASGSYKIDSGSWTTYANGATISIGSDMNIGDSKTLTVKNDVMVNSYVYTKVDKVAISIHYKSASAPTIWLWEEAGRTISSLEGGTWPGPAMAADTVSGWWVYNIPATYYPLTKTLDFKFNGAATAVVLPAPVSTSMWYDGSAWYDHNPDPPAPPAISVNPAGGYYTSFPVTVTATIGADSRAPVTSQEYRVDSGSWTSFSGTLSIGAGLTSNGQSCTLQVRATNSVGTTTSEVYTFTYGVAPKPSFSWDNALVYFVITDRFYNANSGNDNSYGRTNNYGGALSDVINTATFHGGDIAGLTAKLNAGYFKDLGINAIWVTSPYEQAHGFVGGGYSNGAAAYPHYGYHGYYTLDWTEMDKSMGTVEEFRTFVKTAHSQGIRVIMDIVMNHTGYETLADAAEYGFGGVSLSVAAARSWQPTSGGWGTFSAYYAANGDASWNKWWGSSWVRAGKYNTSTGGGGSGETDDISFLPDVKNQINETSNVGLPPVMVTKWAGEASGFDSWIVPAAKTLRADLGISPAEYQERWLAAWVEEFGVDGFRVDTAKHVSIERWQELKNKCNTALTAWRASSRSAGDDAKVWTDKFWMTGEVWGHGVNKSSYFSYGFDSIINFNFPKGQDVSSIGSTWSSLASTLNNGDDGFNVLSYLHSHDSRQNYGWNDTTVNGGTCLILAPGGVQIFYGDEVVRPLAGDMTNDLNQCSRSDYKWSAQNTTVLAHWQKLGTFRKSHISVGGGSQTDLGNSTYGRTLTANGYTDKVVIAINQSGTASVNVSGFFADGASVKNAYTGDIATVAAGKVSFSSGSNGVILVEAN